MDANCTKIKNSTLRDMLAVHVMDVDEANEKFQLSKSNLKSIKEKKKKFDAKMMMLNDQLDNDIKDFKEQAIANISKRKDYEQSIKVFENMIQKEKIKQENYEKNIDSVNADIEQLQEIKFLAKSRIKDYKPYEDMISKVLKKKSQYKNVFDIVSHVQKMSNSRHETLKKEMCEDEDDEQNYFENAEEIRFNLSNKNAILNMEEFVDPRFIRAKQQKSDEHEEYCLIISSILNQYRELYLKKNGILPTTFLSTEDQLKYIFQFYKKTKTLLEICKNII